MNRQSFERWLYQGEAPPENDSDWIAPEAGFSQRWLARWEVEQTRAKETRAFWLAILSSMALLVITLLMAQKTLPLITEPSGFIIGAVNAIMEFFAFLVVAFRVSGTLFRVTPPPVWLALASMASTSALLSVLAFNRFATQKGALR